MILVFLYAIIVPGGGDSFINKKVGVPVVSLRGVNFQILVSLRVLRKSRQYI